MIDEGRSRNPGGELARFTRDLTAEARAGKLEPVRCRDDEVARLIDILLRHGKNNPVLVGPAGVGKTAIVDGFAQRIAFGSVPFVLRDVRVLSLDPAPKLVQRGKPLELTGFVRGLGRIRLERETGAGAWEKVRLLRLAPNGRFRTVVRPDAPTRYRLANHIAVGGAVSVGVR